MGCSRLYKKCHKCKSLPSRIILSIGTTVPCCRFARSLSSSISGSINGRISSHIARVRSLCARNMDRSVTNPDVHRPVSGVTHNIFKAGSCGSADLRTRIHVTRTHSVLLSNVNSTSFLSKTTFLYDWLSSRYCMVIKKLRRQEIWDR